MIVSEGSGTEDNKPYLLQPSGGAQRWPSPCLPISESPRLPLRRVVGVVVVPGKPRSWPLCAAGGVEAAWWPSSARSPALPHPWPGWAAVSVGNSLPPGQPSGPTLQLSNSQAASPIHHSCQAFSPKVLLQSVDLQRSSTCLLHGKSWRDCGGCARRLVMASSIRRLSLGMGCVG